MSAQEQTNETNQTPQEMSQVEMVRALVAADTFSAPINDPAPRKVITPPQLAQGIWNNAPFTPTPSLHPECIKAIEGYAENEGYLAPALNAFSLAHVTLQQISDARAPLTRDTSKTDEQKLLLMATHAQKQQDRILGAFDKATSNLNSAADALDKSLSQPIESVTHTALCQEIRAHIKSLKTAERGAFVSEALQRGDMQILNSVLGAPSYLSGVADVQKANWLRQFHEAKNPASVKRLAAYRKAIELLETRSHLVVTQIEKAQGGKHADVRRLRGQVEESDKALAALGG